MDIFFLDNVLCIVQIIYGNGVSRVGVGRKWGSGKNEDIKEASIFELGEMNQNNSELNELHKALSLQLAFLQQINDLLTSPFFFVSTGITGLAGVSSFTPFLPHLSPIQISCYSPHSLSHILILLFI